jgi:hypothetical protein
MATVARAAAALSLVLVGTISTPPAAGAEPATSHPHTTPFRSPNGTSPRASSASTAFSAPPGAHLQYFGGPLISKVSVHSVYWGNGSYQSGVGPGESGITGFFTGVTSSRYMDWLVEYNQNNQVIRRGSYHGQTQITPSAANNGVTIDATNIEAELRAQLTSGGVPAPQTDSGGNVNTLYALFFPQGKTLTADGGVGGQPNGFCAYHGTIRFGSLLVPYMVLPDFADPLTGYSQGCGGDPSLFNNFTAITSHELIESITDPGVGLATVAGPPLAWYDLANNYGEIADICSPQQGTVLGGNGITYTVQAEFSNAAGNCVITRASVPPPAQGYATACANASAGAFPDAGLAADCLKLYGVALGKTDGTFGENDPLLRSQVSSLLARLVQLAGSSLTQTRTFPDVTSTTVPNAQVRSEIEHLAGSGIIAGFPDGLFHPTANLTVAQGATLVVRTMQFIKSTHPNAPNISDQGTTSANYQYAITQGILDTNASDVNGQPYPAQSTDTTNRGLLADMLAQSVQKLVTTRVVSQR